MGFMLMYSPQDVRDEGTREKCEVEGSEQIVMRGDGATLVCSFGLAVEKQTISWPVS